MTLCIATMSLVAQAGDFGVGANALYGTDIKNAGFGVKAQIGLPGRWRLEGVWDKFLEHNDNNMWDVDVNVHYVLSIPLVKWIKFYPIVGLSVTNWRIDEDIIDFSDKHNYVGCNIGAGAQLKIAGPLWVNVDLKGQIIKKHTQFVPGVGLMLRI